MERYFSLSIRSLKIRFLAIYFLSSFGGDALSDQVRLHVSLFSAEMVVLEILGIGGLCY